MKIYIDKPGTYELVYVDSNEPDAPITVPDDTDTVSPPPSYVKLPIFSPRVERGNCKLHLVKNQITDLYMTLPNDEVAAYPMSIVEVNEELYYYYTDRKNGKSFCSKFGEITVNPIQESAILSDIVLDNGVFYALFEKGKTIFLCVSTDGKRFTLVSNIQTHGVSDTRHTFKYITADSVVIYGRARGADWKETNPRWVDRRGVKVLKYKKNTNTTELLYILDPADFVGGRNDFKKLRIRPSLYSSDSAWIGDVHFSNLGVYFQDEERQVELLDKERPNGTGPTYPVPFVNEKPLRELTDCIFNLTPHERVSKNGKIEVGQIHAGSLIWHKGNLMSPYVVRNGTHYEDDAIEFVPTKQYVATWYKGRLAYLTDGIVTVDNKVKWVDADGSVHIKDNTVTVPKGSKLYYVGV